MLNQLLLEIKINVGGNLHIFLQTHQTHHHRPRRMHPSGSWPLAARAATQLAPPLTSNATNLRGFLSLVTSTPKQRCRR